MILVTMQTDVVRRPVVIFTKAGIILMVIICFLFTEIGFFFLITVSLVK